MIVRSKKSVVSSIGHMVHFMSVHFLPFNTSGRVWILIDVNLLNVVTVWIIVCSGLEVDLGYTLIEHSL